MPLTGDYETAARQLYEAVRVGFFPDADQRAAGIKVLQTALEAAHLDGRTAAALTDTPTETPHAG